MLPNYEKNQNEIDKLKKSTVYSTEEQVVGKCADGKTLYRKVVTYTHSGIIGELKKTTNISIAHGISNFKEIVNCNCNVSGIFTIPICGSSDGTTITSFAGITKVDETNINLRIINDVWGNRTWNITLEYKKTTD